MTRDPVQEFAAFVAETGFGGVCIIGDGQLHRFSLPGETGGKRSGWYVLHVDPPPSGIVGSWKDPDKEHHWTAGVRLSKADRATLDRRIEQDKATRAEERAESQKAAAAEAREVWDASEPAVVHPYLQKKNVRSHGLRIHRGRLVVPVYDIGGNLMSLQTIGGDGVKMFHAGGRVSGGMFTIGTIGADSAAVAVCEGVATGASLFESTGIPTVVAFNAGNLVAVARAVRSHNPHAKVVVAGDDDRHTAGNPGRAKATEAARDVGGVAVFPEFPPGAEGKPTDFNDFRALAGAEAVRGIIMGAVAGAFPDRGKEGATVEDGAQGRKKPRRKKADGGRFITGANGIYWQGEADDPANAPKPQWICSKIEVSAYVRDGGGESWGRQLAFQDPEGTEHTYVLPMSELAGDGVEYRRRLMDLGLQISPNPGARHKLTVFLQGEIPDKWARCVDSPGWHGGMYVLPDETVGGGADSEKILLPGSVEGFRQSGTSEEWKSTVGAACAGNSRLTFAASCAFAGAVLDPVGEESGGFNLRSGSSKGKTSILKAAVSVWGEPDRIQRWRATANGLEAVAVRHSHQLLALDEMSQVGAEIAGEVSYLLSNETAKARALAHGGLRDRKRWKLVFLSTGEVGLAEHLATVGKRARAGQEVRVLDIPAEVGPLGCFEDIHGSPTAAQFADKLRADGAKFYGTPIRAFLREFVQNRDDSIRFLKETVKRFVSANVKDGSSGQLYRAAQRFGMVGAAGELATGAGVTGWQAGAAVAAAKAVYQAWFDSRGGNSDQEVQQVIALIKRFIEAHGQSRFPDIDDGDGKTVVNRAGFRKKNGSGTEYHFLPETFKSEVCPGYDLNSILRALVHKGFLKKDSDGKSSTPVWSSAFGKTIRTYCVLEEVMDSE